MRKSVFLITQMENRVLKWRPAPFNEQGA